MLKIFTTVQIQRLRPGLNPQTWVPEASMLTTRPVKSSPHDQVYYFNDAVNYKDNIASMVVEWNTSMEHQWHYVIRGQQKYSRVSFCNGSFYSSLLWPLSSRTEHSRLAVHHCRNSSVLSVLSALLALFHCACVSSFYILVQFFWVDCDFPTHDIYQKDIKEEKIKTADVTFCLDVFWTTAWAFFSKIKSDLIDIFFNYLCNFLYT